MSTRKLDGGPLLALLGAALLLISLFLDWYEPRFTAWESFEVWDLVLAAAALAAIVTAAGLLRGDEPALERRWLPVLAGLAAVVVISQLLDPPPAVGDTNPVEGGWIALGGALLLALGALLAVARVSFSFSVDTSDRRQRVAAVDARDAEVASRIAEAPAPVPPAAPEPRLGRRPLFARGETPDRPDEPHGDPLREDQSPRPPAEAPVREEETPQPHGDPLRDPPTEETAPLPSSKRP